MSTKWPKVKLREVIRRSAEIIEILADLEYREVTVRLWGNGVVERRRVLGNEIAGSRRFVVRVGQFIVSRIDARNGAMGIIPRELEGAVVTNDFPLFNLKETHLLPEFIGWLCRTRDFVELCQKASEGTTNRVRLKEDRFLNLEIPLPSMAEQQRIVAKINQLAAKIAEARTLRQQAEEEAKAIVHSTMNELLSKAKEDHSWKFGSIPEFAAVNPSRSEIVKLSPTDLVSFVPMKAVDEETGVIAWPETRRYAEVAKGYTCFKDGDIIFARITPCMQNGKSAIARNLVNGMGFGSTEFHVMRPGPELLAEWLHALVRHKAFRSDAEEQFKGTAGQQRVPQSFLEHKKISVPPIPKQRRIVAELDTLQAEVDALKHLQIETAAELDALLPSILDKAFKGEL